MAKKTVKSSARKRSPKKKTAQEVFGITSMHDVYDAIGEFMASLNRSVPASQAIFKFADEQRKLWKARCRARHADGDCENCTDFCKNCGGH